MCGDTGKSLELWDITQTHMTKAYLNGKASQVGSPLCSNRDIDKSSMMGWMDGTADYSLANYVSCLNIHYVHDSIGRH